MTVDAQAAAMERVAKLRAEGWWGGDGVHLVALADAYAALAARLDAAETALREIERAKPTKGVPLKDTIEGCAHIARAARAALAAGRGEHG